VIEGLISEFARHSPGFYDELLLVDSTPVECARSREAVKRGGASSLADALANAADYGYCASHSRFFWGFRPHALFALDGTPRALALTSPTVDEKLVCLEMVARCERQSGRMLILIGDNGRARQHEDPVGAAPRQRADIACQGKEARRSRLVLRGVSAGGIDPSSSSLPSSSYQHRDAGA
jgi:hypothetical protein